MSDVNLAAVCIHERADHRYLCVWNKRYGGWAFPGGKVEDGETPAQAAERELWEETGCKFSGQVEKVYDGPHGVAVEASRGSTVVVFRVDAIDGVPHEREIGCPITWLTREEFLKWSPFGKLYSSIISDGRPTSSRTREAVVVIAELAREQYRKTGEELNYESNRFYNLAEEEDDWTLLRQSKGTRPIQLPNNISMFAAEDDNSFWVKVGSEKEVVFEMSHIASLILGGPSPEKP